MLSEEGPIPAALRIVAALFRIRAAISLGHALFMLAHGTVSLAYAVLGFWIAAGLLRGERRWWRWGVVLSAVDLMLAILGSWLVVIGEFPRSVTMFRVPLTELPAWTWFAVAVPAGLAAAFQLWVLTRPAIRGRFAVATTPDRQPDEIPA